MTRLPDNADGFMRTRERLCAFGFTFHVSAPRGAPARHWYTFQRGKYSERGEPHDDAAGATLDALDALCRYATRGFPGS